MANALQNAGAQSEKPPKFAPIYNSTFLTGLWLQRSPLRDPSTRVEAIYYGGRQEALIRGVNVELTNARTLARRPGCTNFSPGNTVAEAINSFYAFKSFSTVSENIQVMMDGLTQIYTITPTAITSIFTKGVAAGVASMFGINNTLYIGDGVDQQAWPGTGSTRNWGIAIGGGVATTASAYAGVGTDTGASWTSPGNIVGAPNATYATATIAQGTPTISQQTSWLQANTYGFALSGTTVTQITANVTAHVHNTGFNVLPLQFSAQLLVNGTPTGPIVNQTTSSATDVVLPFTFTNIVTDAQANLAIFGVQLRVQNIFIGHGIGATWTFGTPNIDSAQIVISQIGATVGVPTGSGSLTTATGWKYVYEYANSNSGGFSPASPVGASTGPFTSKASVNVPVVASTDPQVNQIWVFRTADGGATFLSLPTNPYPNTTATIVDTNPDNTLTTTQLADIVGLNTPPPVGIGGMVFHMGRLWGFVNNVLYYAVGPDLGNILGNPYEGWPPANFFTLPSKITKLIPTSVGLLVFTVSDIYIVYGNASATAAATGVAGLAVFYVAPFVQAVGLLNQFAADVNGTTIYLFTTDKQFLSIDPSSGFSEIGFPIGEPNIAYPNDSSLASFDPAQAHVTWHVAGSKDKAVYLADGSTGWFRCNTSQPPEGGFVWSPKANIVGGCDAVFSIETSPGVRQLLIGPAAGGGSVLFRDTTVFADNLVAYPSNLVMGNIVLAYPGQIAQIDFITCDYNRVGTSPIVSVLLDEINGTFTNISGYVHSDPPSIYGTTLSPATLYANRHDFYQTVAGGAPPPVYCRHLQISIDFGATDQVKNEMLSSTIYGCFHAEK